MSNGKMDITGKRMRRATGFTNGYGRSYQRSNIPELGGEGGFCALRDKATGEIHVPSVYYTFCEGSTDAWWDSANNCTYTEGKWKITKYNSEIEAMLKRLRKKGEDFEIVAFNLKAGSNGMPYNRGYSYNGNYNLYMAGPSPIPRAKAQEIKQIVVLQDGIYTNAKKGKVQDKNAIEAIEPMEV